MADPASPATPHGPRPAKPGTPSPGNSRDLPAGNPDVPSLGTPAPSRPGPEIQRLPKPEARRLGKLGAYRLGDLRVLGSPPRLPRAPREPAFGARRSRTGLSRWLGWCAVVAALVGAGAWLGLWWLPFPLGVVAGLTPWRARSALSWAALSVVVGWGVTLWLPAVLGAPAGATAREVAALAGLPPFAFVAVVATILVGVIQALVALWLTRALRPRGGPA